MEIVNSINKSNILIYSKNPSELFLGTSLTMRNLTKHVLTVFFTILLTMTIWKITKVPTSLTGLYSIGWVLVIYWAIVSTYKKSIKLLHMINNEFLVIAAIIIAFVTFGSILAFFVVNKADEIKTAKDFYQIVYWVFPFLYFTNAGWYLLIAYFEKRTRPFMSVVLVYRAITSVLLSVVMLVTHFLVIERFLVDKPSFDLHNKFEMTILVITGAIFIFTMIVEVVLYFQYYGFTHDEFVRKSTAYGVALVIVLPIAIWFIFHQAKFRETMETLVYTLMMITIAISAMLFAFLKKNQVNSSKIFLVVNSLLLAVVWVLNYYFENEYKYFVDQSYAKGVALAVTSAIAFAVYLRSAPSPNWMASMIYESMMWIIVIISVALWMLAEIKISLAMLPFELNTMLSAVIIAFPALILMFSALSWYWTSRKLIKNVKYFYKPLVIVDANNELDLGRSQNINDKNIEKIKEKQQGKRNVRKEVTNE